MQAGASSLPFAASAWNRPEDRDEMLPRPFTIVAETPGWHDPGMDRRTLIARQAVAGVLLVLAGVLSSCEDTEARGPTAVTWTAFSWDAEAREGERSFSSFSIRDRLDRDLYYTVGVDNADTENTHIIRVEVKQFGQVVDSRQWDDLPTDPEWYYYVSKHVDSSSPTGAWVFAVYRDSVLLAQGTNMAYP